MSDINWNQLTYQEQLDKKASTFNERLAEFTDLEPEIHSSNETGYRMRAEFQIWHEGEQTHYAMSKPGTKERYFVESFPPASTHIQTIMSPLMEAIRSEEILRHRLFAAEFLSSTQGEMLVTLIYHKPLNEEWQASANKLCEELGINLIGRSKKQKVVLGQDYVTETVDVAKTQYRYKQFENTFTQPNAEVNQKMLSWADQQAASLDGDLLELYCGNGNFTLPLSKHFDKVLATEISKGSVAALNWAIEENHIANIHHARLSAEEVTHALDKVRPFRRLSHLDLDEFDFSTVFVDPPRAGIDEKTIELLKRFDNILYISCNPETLFRDIERLSNTHQVCSAAIFDQFPFTHHLESGVRLSKKSAN